MDYTLLEPSFSKSLGFDTSSTFIKISGSFVESSVFLFSLLISLCILGFAYSISRAGILRTEASEANIRRSNEMIKNSTLGLLGVLALYLIIGTINPDLLQGDVGLSGLSSGPVANNQAQAGGAGATGDIGLSGKESSGTPSSCDNKSNVIDAIKAGNICGNTQCTALSGCNYQTYLDTIKSAASAQGVDYKILVALMCKESKGDKNAQHKNDDGSYDCGLMQINQKTPCDASVLDPKTNISSGANLFKQKNNSVSQTYQSVPQYAGAFASYNCCSNGTNPNAPSDDCNTSSGFPGSIPKWGCPINPGSGSSNMCSVKNYACDLTACLNSI